MQKIVYNSRAKVNIGLQVRNQRSDGYHNLHTVFQEIDLCDRIAVTKFSSGWIITTDKDWVPQDETNICIKAYLAIKNEFPDIGGIEVNLEKRIPAGGGLGGGSSNGAAVLKATNELYGLGLSFQELEQIGAGVGADVPFFIKGGIQLGEGIGEILTPLPAAIMGKYLLVVPPFGINTGEAYKALKNKLISSDQRINFRGYFQGDNSPLSIFENDFEKVMIPAHPEIGEIKEALLETGAKYASLSGSGSTVFGIFDDETCLRQAESKFQSTYPTFITEPIF